MELLAGFAYFFLFVMALVDDGISEFLFLFATGVLVCDFLGASITPAIVCSLIVFFLNKKGGKA